MEIKTINDVKQVTDQCIKKIGTEQNVVYFNLIVGDNEGILSNCYFSPIAPLRKENENILFVHDIEKLLRMLLSHPKVSNLEYDPKENMISATFQDETEDPEEQKFHEFYEEKH